MFTQRKVLTVELMASTVTFLGLSLAENMNKTDICESKVKSIK